MIVFSNKPGQLGNMLFIYANLLAYGLEHGVNVRNPAFYEYQSYFTGTHQRSSFLSKLAYGFCFYAARLLDKLKIRLPFVSATCLNWHEGFDLDARGQELDKALCLLQGWQYRAPQSVRKHRETIHNFFSPAEQHARAISAFFEAKFDLQNEILIGVHIRRGDYKNFEGGKYFYDIDTYRGLMRKAAALFSEKKVHFLICSNETIDPEALRVDGAAVTMAMNHELLDMYCLASTHYMIGPPSTYSMWASAYGAVPLYQFRGQDQAMRLTDFAVYSSF